jgi:RluA family pseudouridine synthase
MRKWEVSVEESGVKLLPFLKKKSEEHLSVRQIKQALERGQCLVNGQVERFGSVALGYGDEVAFLHSDTQRKNNSPSSIGPVLYVDDDLVVYHKPAGVASDDKSLFSQLYRHFSHLQLVHRLDRDTTGVLVFARSQEVYNAMLTLFRKRKIHKTYLAIVDGLTANDAGVIENYLGKLCTYQGQAIWGEVLQEKGLYARTTWHVKKKGTHASLLECCPETGRTHQIRVHLHGIGHPILGDYHYCRKFSCPYLPNRCLLHAWKIGFAHPRDNRWLEVTAPLPHDFQEANERL